MTASILEQVQREHDAALQEKRAATSRLDRDVAGPRKEELEAARADVRAKDQAHQMAQRQLAKATLRAPFFGHIENRFVDQGAYVNVFPTGGVPIVRLVDLGEIDVVIAVPQQLRAHIDLRESVTVASVADPPAITAARVIALSSLADPTTGTYALRVRLDNSDQRFQGGMVVTASIKGDRDRQAIRIPLAAVHHAYGQPPAVMLVHAQTRNAVLRPIELRDEVQDAAPVWQRVRQKLASAGFQLPAGVIGPELDDEIMGTFAQLIALTSDAASYRELEDAAQELEDRLRYLPMTASTSLFGVQPEVIEVELDAARLAAHHLSWEQVSRVIARRNTQQPAGRLQANAQELLIEPTGEFSSERELGHMVLVTAPGGRTIRLSDVAHIQRKTQTPAEPLARLDGHRAVILGVRAREAIRIDQFGDRIHAEIDTFRDTLPDHIQCAVFHDMARYTRDRARQLSRTLLMCVACVFLSTSLFMGWRGACVVTSAVPVTGLLVLLIFYALGIPLNQMSVMAIIMAFGLLVDNAIVVTEQIHRRTTQSQDLRQAAGDEPARLLPPLIVSTLTTIAAFLPIYLLPGGTGEFVRAIPLGVAVCLVTSLLVAVTVVPLMCSLLGHPWRSNDMSPIGRLGQRCEQAYRRQLQGIVKRPATVLVVSVPLMVSLAAVGLTLRRDFFSPVQRDQFVIDVFAPQGTSVEGTAEVVAQVEQLLLARDDVADVASFIGRNAPLIFYNLESQETYANHYAQLVVRARDGRSTATIAASVQQELNAEISRADCCAHILEHGAPFVAPFELRLAGNSTTVLRELGRRTSRLLRNTPGVRNIRVNYGNESPKLVAEVNEPIARRIGIDQDLVASELCYRLDGLQVTEKREGDERIGIVLRSPPSSRNEVADLQSIYLKPSPQTGLIPLATVARVVPRWEDASIYRRDGRRTLSVLAYPQFGLTPAQVSRRFKAAVAHLQARMPVGYTLEFGGENEQRYEAESKLLQNAVYAVFPFLLLLMAEFRSVRLVVLIVFIVPLSLGGTMVGLYLTGWPLNFMAIMGMMMLIGVVVNDAVLLVDGFERRRRTGESLEGIVIDGTLERGRHIVITTVTTIAGFLPLALSPSLLWPPLAIAVIGGLALATCLTLVVVPAGYTILRLR